MRSKESCRMHGLQTDSLSQTNAPGWACLCFLVRKRTWATTENGHAPQQEMDIFHNKKRTFSTTENGHDPQQETDIFHNKKRTFSTAGNGHDPHEKRTFPEDDVYYVMHRQQANYTHIYKLMQLVSFSRFYIIKH